MTISELETREEELTVATRPVEETAPTARPDCLNAFLNIMQALLEKYEDTKSLPTQSKPAKEWRN